MQRKAPGKVSVGGEGTAQVTRKKMWKLDNCSTGWSIILLAPKTNFSQKLGNYVKQQKTKTTGLKIETLELLHPKPSKDLLHAHSILKYYNSSHYPMTIFQKKHVMPKCKDNMYIHLQLCIRGSKVSRF